MPKTAKVNPDGTLRRNIMRNFTLKEISAVDRPAQEGARMVLMKRAEEPPESWLRVSLSGLPIAGFQQVDVEKLGGDLADLFTSSEGDHQHGVSLSVYDGEPYIYISHAAGSDGENHDHQIMVQDGEFVLSENNGHTHTLDASMVQTMLMSLMIERKRAPDDPGEPADKLGNQPLGDDDMAEKNAAELAADLKKRDDQILDLTAIVNLPADHRAHYDTLPDVRKGAYLHSSAASRADAIENAEKANPVVYTDDKGREYLKSDDTRLIEMAKERDEDRKETAKFRVEADLARFEKRASAEMDLIPGETVTKVAILRAIDAIEDADVRAEASKMLKAANKIFQLALKTDGVTAGEPPAATSAKDFLKTKVLELVEKDGISEPEAYKKYLATKEGRQVYEATRQERIANSN